MIHTLKIKDEYLENLRSGDKKSDIRYNDRDYQAGDIVQYLDPEKANEIMVEDRYLRYQISHIHSGLGLEKGYVVLSLVEE